MYRKKWYTAKQLFYRTPTRVGFCILKLTTGGTTIKEVSMKLLSSPRKMPIKVFVFIKLLGSRACNFLKLKIAIDTL